MSRRYGRSGNINRRRGRSRKVVLQLNIARFPVPGIVPTTLFQPRPVPCGMSPDQFPPPPHTPRCRKRSCCCIAIVYFLVLFVNIVSSFRRRGGRTSPVWWRRGTTCNVCRGGRRCVEGCVGGVLPIGWCRVPALSPLGTSTRVDRIVRHIFCTPAVHTAVEESVMANRGGVHSLRKPCAHTAALS